MMMARCKEQRASDLPDGRALENSVQYRQQKYFASRFGRNSFMDSNRPTPLQGRIAIVTDAGCGCGGRGSVRRETWVAGRVGERPVSDQQRADERCCSVRRSRVVLTPRRWRQVRGVKSAQPGLDKTYPRTTVAKQPDHRGEYEGNR